MKIVNINFLGTEYSIQCEDHEVSKIRNLEARLNNRIKLHIKDKHNFTDTHKLLIITLSLEDKITVISSMAFSHEMRKPLYSI